MIWPCVVAIVLQGAATVVDEGFHRGRGLPRRERIGHPLGTLTIVVCLVWLLAIPRDEATDATLPIYVALAAASTAFVIQDERGRCSAGERRVHVARFTLHPAALAAFAYLWWIDPTASPYGGADGRGQASTIDASALLVGQLGVALAFMAYQAIYWNLSWNPWRVDAGDAWVCDGPGDGQVLVDEVRARPVRDR